MEKMGQPLLEDVSYQLFIFYYLFFIFYYNFYMALFDKSLVQYTILASLTTLRAVHLNVLM